MYVLLYDSVRFSARHDSDSVYRNPKFIDHTFSSFFPLLISSIVESLQVLTYFWVYLLDAELGLNV